MTSTPLNEEALDAAILACASYMGRSYESVAKAVVGAYLAVAQPVMNSVEELDALPVGSVIVVNDTMLQADDRDDYGTMWSRVRDIDAYQSDALVLPATVLHRPEVTDD